jgi:hypothetical protein
MAAGDFKQASNLNAFIAAGQVGSANSEVTVHTVPASSQEKIATAVVCNVGAAAATISVSLVPSGGTAGATNRVITAYALAAGDSTKIVELEGAMLPTGAFITINSSVASAVDYSITGAVSA